MKIFLISCVKKKQNITTLAKDMYISSLFKKAYAYAKSNGADKIFILSAKYGLLSENQVIEPYDETLNNKKVLERKVWSADVIKKLSVVADLNNDEFVLLAGEKYRKFLTPHLLNFSIPLQGLSFGRQLAFYKANLL